MELSYQYKIYINIIIVHSCGMTKQAYTECAYIYDGNIPPHNSKSTLEKSEVLSLDPLKKCCPSERCSGNINQRCNTAE